MEESVQSLAEKGLGTIPASFVRSEGERPGYASCMSTIPVISLDDDRSNLVSSIGRACGEWGFFQVINHGIPLEIMQGVRDAGQNFFGMPMSHKLKWASPEGQSAAEGYAFRMLTRDDQVLDWRDYLNHHTLPLSRRNSQNWPHDYRHRNYVEEYSSKTLELAKNLLGIISESLGLETSYIEKAIGEPYQNIVINYYPPCPQPDLTLGLQSHSDFGAVTLLMEDDVGGLQVRKNNEWYAVKPVSGALIVNLGDQVEIVSNGRYPSIEHRVVVNSNKSRMAVAAFYDPSKETRISPATKLIDKDHPQMYREVLFRDHVSDFYDKGPEGKRNLDSIAMN